MMILWGTTPPAPGAAFPVALWAQASSPDTTVVVWARTPLDFVTSIATVAIAVILAALLFSVLLMLWNTRRGFGKLRSAVQEAGRGVDPILERGQSIAENVDFISAVVRSDIEKLRETISQLGDRLQDASDQMQRRIEAFNALVEVVQGEAEEVFLDTASTVRGVRAGARELGRPGGARTHSDRIAAAEAAGLSGDLGVDADPDEEDSPARLVDPGSGVQEGPKGR